ncbi:MAG: hypothetical protein JWQ82_618, partial [Tardiphaga sp.]|nr:hypothetical protein [Tardiphaga sp.]
IRTLYESEDFPLARRAPEPVDDEATEDKSANAA